MRHLLLYTVFTVCLFSCQQQDDSKQAAELNANQAADSSTAIGFAQPTLPDSAYLIVPGKQIGQVELNITPDQLNNKLGKPDSGDAAMGKALSFWVTQNNRQRGYVAAYTVSNFDGSGSPPKVQQAQVTLPEFKTTSGLGTGMPLTEIRKQFKNLKQLAYYTTKDNQRVHILDDEALGIAFEVNWSRQHLQRYYGPL